MFSVITSLSISAQNITINSVSLSATPHMNCSTVTATIDTYLGCINATHTGNTVIISGNTVTINIDYTIGGICLPAISYPTHVVPLTNLPLGSVTINVNGNWNAATVSNLSVYTNVLSCCPSYANAGADTALCDQNQLTLNANTPPSFATATWSVINGGATLSGTTNPNAVASNLSNGANTFVWTFVDSVCTTRDTLVVVNDVLPTTPLTESDRFSCYDTTTISANTLSIGSGKWLAHTAGVAVLSNSNPVSKVFGLKNGTNIFSWTTTNGACKLADTLKIAHSIIATAPTITANGFLLTSTTAPAYQWYLDQAIIPGANGQSHTVIANGVYAVKATEVGCDNGLFSNEIEYTQVGINNINEGMISISPNPSQGIVTISNVSPGSTLSLLDIFGKEIRNLVIYDMNTIIDFSDQANGIYFIKLNDNNRILTSKILLKK